MYHEIWTLESGPLPKSFFVDSVSCLLPLNPLWLDFFSHFCVMSNCLLQENVFNPFWVFEKSTSLVDAKKTFWQGHIRTLGGRIVETILSLRFVIFQYGIVYKLQIQGSNTSFAVRTQPVLKFSFSLFVNSSICDCVLNILLVDNIFWSRIREIPVTNKTPGSSHISNVFLGKGKKTSLVCWNLCVFEVYIIPYF